jgi:hypothetical protein
MSTLESLAEQWREAKRAEDEARDRRVEIESRIIEQTGVKEEGSQTHSAGDWKIKVTGKLNRKLDADAWADVEPSIPEDLRPVSYTPKLETKGLRYLEANEPDVYRMVARAIETKPDKPAVEVK